MYGWPPCSLVDDHPRPHILPSAAQARIRHGWRKLLCEKTFAWAVASITILKRLSTGFFSRAKKFSQKGKRLENSGGETPPPELNAIWHLESFSWQRHHGFGAGSYFGQMNFGFRKDAIKEIFSGQKFVLEERIIDLPCLAILSGFGNLGPAKRQA